MSRHVKTNTELVFPQKSWYSLRRPLTPLGSLRVFAPGGEDPAYERGGDARRLA